MASLLSDPWYARGGKLLVRRMLKGGTGGGLAHRKRHGAIGCRAVPFRQKGDEFGLQPTAIGRREGVKLEERVELISHVASARFV
ncbi:MAG: hypothetical protein AAF844_04975, partial [Pseudomonadota bacterium]